MQRWSRASRGHLPPRRPARAGGSRRIERGQRMTADAGADGGGALRRRVGPGLLLLYGLGTMVGAGIWVLVGEVAGTAGLAAPLAFLVAAAVAALSGIGYAALAGAMPEAGGEVVWVERAFGRRLVTAVTGWGVALTGLVSAATLTRGFAGYAAVLVPAPDWAAMVVLVAALTLLAVRGIQETAWAATALTLVSVAALLWLIGARFDALGDAPRLAAALPGLDPDAWTPVFAASFVAFYAFIGFEDMVNLAEEVRRPARTMAVAILGALLAAALLYGLVCAVAVLAVPPEDLAAQDAPLAYVMGRGSDDPAIALAGLVSVSNSALAQIVMAARVLLSLARRGAAPARFARIGGRGTPGAATLAAASVVLGLAVTQELAVLARITSGVVLVVFAMVNAAVIVLRRRDAAVRVPLAIPVLGLLCTLALLGASLAT